MIYYKASDLLNYMNLCLKFTDLESELPYLKSMLKKSSKASS